MTPESFTHTFDQCGRPTAPNPGPFAALWLIAEGRNPGCDNAQPWWTNLWISTALAAAVGITCALNDLGPMSLAYLAFAFLGHTAITTYANPRRRHAFCEICGHCSVTDGVRPARSLFRAAANARASHWTVHPYGDRAHCPGHTHLPFVGTY